MHTLFCDRQMDNNIASTLCRELFKRMLITTYVIPLTACLQPLCRACLLRRAACVYMFACMVVGLAVCLSVCLYFWIPTCTRFCDHQVDNTFASTLCRELFKRMLITTYAVPLAACLQPWCTACLLRRATCLDMFVCTVVGLACCPCVCLYFLIPKMHTFL